MLEGNVAEIDGTFTDSSGVLFDPATVVLKYQCGQTSGQYTYADGDIDKLRTGRYRGYVYLDTSGEWTFQWEVNGSKRGLGEKKLRVTARTIQ